ncbi:hypothetical protein GUJ93_ZPchr0005g16087 [Zizania palustris]|uniref:Uncharacterized protein n=1 Tax=Zizania palustris TaxID=103762 RepID=A0A8J5W064_ZIZPA|nr:hypothetical protein GUJ93_ZPchr0005g16087 [Zizania palustris]
MEELKQSLMVTTLELEAAKEELKKKEQSIVKLADLVRQVTKERDDARDQLQQLLAAAAAKPPAPVTSSVTDSDCSLVSSPVDPFFDPVTSSDKRCKISSPPPAARQQSHAAGAGASADAVLDMLAMKKPLPQRGRLLQSVMEAGPLLQNLLVAGLLPRWRNPPPVAVDTLPVGVRGGGGGGYASTSLAPVINSAPVLGYGSGHACAKRPMSAASCSPGFSAKRHRLH